MTEAEILKEIGALPCGASFHRADLHIHSFGGSYDVKDAAMTPKAIVEAAVAEKLDIVAITDHNDIVNVAAALEAAKGQATLVIPGIELSTPEGHLLVYCCDLVALTEFYGSIKIIDRGTDKSRCQTALLECLNKIDTAKGFAILAHVDGEGGLETKLTGNPPIKTDILTHRALLGIELKAADSQVSYSPDDPDGNRAQIGIARQQKLGLGGRQFLGRVLFSDSHSLAALGKNAQGARRLTRVKMDKPTFESLRVAFIEADARLRLEEQIPESVPYIKGVRIEGGFLDGQSIHFSRNLNCIVGGRGAGKSTTLEVVRCISPRGSDSKLVDSEVWPQLFHVVWSDQAGEMHTLERRINCEGENLTNPDQGAAVMAIEAYGQGDAAKTSQNAQSEPSALLEFLDQFINLEAHKEEEKQVLDELLANQTEIEKSKRQVSQIPQYLRAQSIAKQALQALQAAKAEEVVALERKVAEERNLRVEIENAMGELVAATSGSPVGTSLASIRDLAATPDLAVGGEQCVEINKLVGVLEVAAKLSEKSVEDAVKTFSASVKEHLCEWKVRERKIIEQIEAKRQELLKKGVKLDLAYIRKLAQDEADCTKKLTSLRAWEKHLEGLKKERRELLERRVAARAKIFGLRDVYARRSSEMLADSVGDLTVSIKFDVDAHSPDAEAIIQEAMNWRTVQVPRAALLVQELTVPKLLDSVRRKNTDAICALKNEDGAIFNRADAGELITRLADDTVMFKLERVAVDDLPRITVTKRIDEGGGKVRHFSRAFAKLSLGQQQSVLLTLMLSADSNRPLIIDQPEDNLDGEFIYRFLVPALRRAKERRQVVVVTHNPNIAVLGDAEQIVALKSLSDSGKIVSRGSIDHVETRNFVCSILEGAEEAFKRRAVIYGVLT